MAKQTLQEFDLGPAVGFGLSPKLRLASDQDFVASTGELVMAGDSRKNYREFSPTVDGVNLLSPDFVVDTNTDSSHPNGTYTLYLVDSSGNNARAVFSNWSFTASFGESVSFFDLEQYNGRREVLRSPGVYDKDQINARFTAEYAPDASDTVKGKWYRSRLEEATTATLPAAGVVGRLRRVTDAVRGFVFDTGTRWINALMGNVCVEEYATLSAMVADIGATERTVYVPASYSVAASVTIPSNITLLFTGSGKFDIASGQTVTIQGSFEAPNRQIFTGAGLVSFASNYRLSYFLAQWWGAKGDRSGTSGTDDTSAIQASWTAAGTSPVRLAMRVNAQFLIRDTNGASTGVLKMPKLIDLKRTGGRGNGFYCSTDTPTTVPLILFKPEAFPDNEGWEVEGFTIGSSGSVHNGSGSWGLAPGGAGGGHSIKIDGSLLEASNPGANIRNVRIRNILFLHTGGLSGFDAINGTSGGTHGLMSQSDVEYCVFYQGVNCNELGDTFHLDKNTFLAYSQVNLSQVVGATTLTFDKNGVGTRYGVHIGRAVRLSVKKNIIELGAGDSVGYNNAIIDIDGNGGTVDGGEVAENVVTNLAGPLIDGIRINNAQNIDTHNNHISVRAGAYNYKQLTSQFNLKGFNTYYGASQDDSIFDGTAVGTSILGTLGELPAGSAFAGYLSLLGSIRAMGALGRAALMELDNRDATLFSLFKFSELGTQKGGFNLIGSNFATAALRNAFEIFTSAGSGGGLNFFVDGSRSRGWSLSPTRGDFKTLAAGVHLGQSAANGDNAGVLTISAGTSVSKNFTVAFLNTPVVVAYPLDTAALGGATYSVTRSTSGFTITTSASVTASFGYFVHGNPD